MLHVHRAERADGLVRALGDLLRRPPADPFAPEVVAVPTRGMERWLTQQLSGVLGTSPGRGDGVCANVAFPSPHALVREAVAAEDDPWLPERAVWPLLEVVDHALGEPWLAGLSRHLEGENDGARRFATVRRLADLFDRYALHRPELVRSWAESRADRSWQAELWRRLREHLGEPGPAERREEACARLAAQPALLDLPDRIGLFGLTRLPAGHLDVWEALAAGRDVHLYLLHPSAALWEAVAGAPPVTRRADDATSLLARHRLLASWGRDARELQLVLGARPHTSRHHPVDAPGDAQLHKLQADIRADRPVARHPPDGSIQVHACHGRARQVEVLRDAILHLLARDETLEPRDVIVLCPDIETYAPLVHATFGTGDEAAGLRVRLADRSLRRTNPVLGTVAHLLDLAGRRLTASEVLDLADREPVRRRFGFDDEALARLRDWVAAGGIRWGLDAEHRAPFKLHALDAGTWRTGLDRLLVGVTMTEDEHRLYEGVLPVDDVESGAIDLAGRVAELVERLGTVLDALRGRRPIAAWAGALAGAADALAATGPGDAWQRAQLERILDAVVEEAGGSDVPVSLPEVRALLADRLAGRPTRANFRTGHLTVCTLVPMRSIPHRVVCLLGLDDGAFPRRAPRDGDDLTLEDPRVGERDPRSEDRQMLLDALMAAGDHLVITYTGNDVRTNAPRPPAVPVGELLDAVGHDVLVRHPLQPFDPRNFTEPWSFDAVMLEGARAPRAAAASFLPEPLPPVEASVVALADLEAFLRHPVRAFLRQRLGFGLGRADDDVGDALPVELGALERWQAGDRLLAARLDGIPPDVAEAAERARGALPPGRLADPVLAAVRDDVEGLVRRASALTPEEGASVDVRVALPDGRALSGTVPGVHGALLRTVTFSRLNARHRLVAWVRFLALTAARPATPFEAVTLGRGEEGAAVIRLPRMDPGAAVRHLGDLVRLHDAGLREPLPLASATSAAWAAGRDARREWESRWGYDREDRDPEHELVFGRLSFDELRARPGFDALARRLWAGPLEWER